MRQVYQASNPILFILRLFHPPLPLTCLLPLLVMTYYPTHEAVLRWGDESFAIMSRRSQAYKKDSDTDNSRQSLLWQELCSNYKCSNDHTSVGYPCILTLQDSPGLYLFSYPVNGSNPQKSPSLAMQSFPYLGNVRWYSLHFQEYEKNASWWKWVCDGLMFPLSCHCCHPHIFGVYIGDHKLGHGRLHISSAFLAAAFVKDKIGCLGFFSSWKLFAVARNLLRIHFTQNQKQRILILQSASQRLEEMTFKKLEISQCYSIERLSQHVILFDSEHKKCMHGWKV